MTLRGLYSYFLTQYHNLFGNPPYIYIVEGEGEPLLVLVRQGDTRRGGENSVFDQG